MVVALSLSRSCPRSRCRVWLCLVPLDTPRRADRVGPQRIHPVDRAAADGADREERRPGARRNLRGHRRVADAQLYRHARPHGARVCPQHRGPHSACPRAVAPFACWEEGRLVRTLPALRCCSLCVFGKLPCRFAIWNRTCGHWSRLFDLLQCFPAHPLALFFFRWQSPAVQTYDVAEEGDLARVVDFAICCGGDGTMLNVSRLFPTKAPPILAFAMGSFGFLTNFCMCLRALAVVCLFVFFWGGRRGCDRFVAVVTGGNKLIDSRPSFACARLRLCHRCIGDSH